MQTYERRNLNMIKHLIAGLPSKVAYCPAVLRRRILIVESVPDSVPVVFERFSSLLGVSTVSDAEESDCQ